MPPETEASKSAENGKLAFEAGNYESAAELFRAAAAAYAALQDQANAAEQKSNLSVALLKMGRARDALDAVGGTDQVFADAGDSRRQGIAFNNQAVALESLNRWDEAVASYERAAKLLTGAGEGELRASTLKAAAGIQLRRGRLTGAGLSMIGALEAREHPSFLERILRALLRAIFR
jgi:tetratricopeptide (TPR) repeat protein